MSIGIGENLDKSFRFAKDSLIGKWLNWLLLIIVTIIPIVNFIGIGTFLKIFRGEEPKVENIGKSFVDGLLVFVIELIYMIVPLIIMVALGAVIGDIGAFIGAILMVIVMFILYPAIYNFAQKGFGAAFAFGDLFALIGKVGWGKYILSLIVLIIVLSVIALVISLISMIPILGILGALVMLIIAPALSIVSYKFIANLFA